MLPSSQSTSALSFVVTPSVPPSMFEYAIVMVFSSSLPRKYISEPILSHIIVFNKDGSAPLRQYIPPP